MNGNNNTAPSGADGSQAISSGDKRFKANPTILNGANGDLLKDAIVDQ